MDLETTKVKWSAMREKLDAIAKECGEYDPYTAIILNTLLGTLYAGDVAYVQRFAKLAEVFAEQISGELAGRR